MLVTGSQSATITRMLSLNFASMACNCKIGFLTFNEYLRFTDKLKLGDLCFAQLYDIESIHDYGITSGDYYNYVYGGYAFSKAILNLRSYLDGCLAEVVRSCKNSMQGVGNDIAADCDIDTVITVMYALLFKLHNVVSEQNLLSGSFYAEERHALNYEKENGFKTKQEVLSQVSYKIKYPVLYIVILKETLRSSYKVQM